LSAPHAITIGSFDGVHVGHRALVARARALAGPAGRVTALVFDPHPATLLRPQETPARLTTFDRRAVLLREAGADHVERLVPTAELLAQPAEMFVEWIGRAFAPSAIVEGPDFRFGKGRAGNILLLESLGAAAGFRTDVVPPVEVVLTDHTVAPASSTLVRWLLAEGRVRDAAIVLGRPYQLDAVVERGDRRGRTIGFPTANLRTDCLIPADGIYACEGVLPDGRAFAAGVHVGPRETFDDRARVVEAHLIGPGRDAERIAGLPEYGWEISLRFIAWLRDPARFESVDHLVERMHLDCRRAADIIARHPQETPA
jgi:riboflavin kinase/FMN adenylyltransferase